MNRRGFIAGLFAVTAAVVAPVKWAAAKARSMFVNVRDYGARGDGKTNDGPAIQRAIDDADGRTVYLPSGTYNIDTPIKWGVRFVGEGPGTVVRDCKWDPPLNKRSG